MKNGKRLTREQKNIVQALGLNPADWLISKNDSQKMVIVHRDGSKTQTIYKKGG